MLYNNILASRFETANTIMYTIQNIVLYSVLAFIYSVTAVVYPKLSMLAAQKDIALFKESLIKILKTVSFFMVPAAFGFILLNRRMADVFLAWNRITPDNLDLASGMMAFYAAGVIGLGIKEVLDRAFWSLQDTKRPAINSITMMAVNIVISLAAIQFIGPLGIPLAYTVSSLTGGIILVIMMRNKIGPFGIRSLVMSAAKSFLSGIAMTAAVLFVNKLTVDLSFSGVFTDRMMKLLIPTATGIMVYFPAAFLMKSEEAVGIFNKMKNLILPGRKAA
jgi:putative peptidoglycan lipid II flippase